MPRRPRLRTLSTALLTLLSAALVAPAPAARAASLTAAPPPSIPVGSGPVRNGTLITWQLADHLELKVNVGSGNALVRTSDLTLPAIDRNLELGAAYNSLLIGSGVQLGSIGHGWRTREGVDVRLHPADDGSVTYLAADGVAGKFTPRNGSSSYDTPREFKAGLVKTGSGWELTEHETGRKRFFHTSGLLDKIQDRNKNTTDFTYDGSNRWTKVEYLPRGETTGRSVSVTYNSLGLIAEYAQNDGGSTTRRVTYTYDSYTKDLIAITEPAGETINLGYASGHRLISIKNGRGFETRIGYDDARRVTSVAQVRGADPADAHVTRLAYPSATRTLVADPSTDQSLPVADVPHTTYDLNESTKRVTKTTDPAGNERSRSYTPFHDVAASTNAIGGTTTNTYGANNGESLTTSQSSTGASRSFAYANPPTADNPTANFQPSSSRDPQGNDQTYSYNGPGNLVSAEDGNAAKASVEYNDDGTAKSSTDPENDGNPTTYTYDDTHHQLIRITPPTGNSLGVRQFTYDGFGRLRTTTDGAGRTTTYDYDLSDRLTKVTYSDGTPGISLRYDRAGNLVERTDASGTTTWKYAARNLVYERSSTSGGGVLTYTHDAVGNITSLTDGRGTTRYFYGARRTSLLTGMTDSAGNKWSFAYDGDGRRTHTFFGYVSATEWTARTVVRYDKSGRVKRMITTRHSDPANIVSDISYCYAKHVPGRPCSTAEADDTGLRQWSKDEKTGEITVYSYDKGNRLTKATNVAGKTYEYTYDTNGNRTSVKVDGTETQRLTHNSANQVTSSGNGYDGAGNQTATPGRSMRYNAAGQMTAADGRPYAYAGPDQVELVKAGDVSLVYGRADQHGQAWIQSYTRGPATTYIERDGHGTPLALRDGTTGAVHYLVPDGLGSTVALIGTDGDVDATYTYDPYGRVVDKSGPMADANLLRFTGAFTDPATGFTKLGLRYYNPDQGRFTQQDSIVRLADPANANRYAYAACDPVNKIDPTGAISLSDAGEIAQVGFGCLEGALIMAEAAQPFAVSAAALGGVSTGAVLFGAAVGGCAIGALSVKQFNVSALSGN